MNLETCPPQYRLLLHRIVQDFRDLLGDQLAGIYLHGSLAMGAFNPASSDLDYLVLVHDPLSVAQKQAIIAFTLEQAADAPPKGLEFSVLLLRHTQHFVHPAHYELHYSPDWNERYRSGAVDWIATATDRDLAAHITVTIRRGVCLYGMAIDQAFADVPPALYRDAIYYDLADVPENIYSDPVYCILNVCRIAAYVQSGQVLSKSEGGEWGLQHLIATFHPLIEQALTVYRGDGASVTWDTDTFTQFVRYAREVLQF